MTLSTDIPPAPRYDLHDVSIKKYDKRSEHKGLTPKMWTMADKDYYSEPRQPWKCVKCDQRFKYRKQVKEHLQEVHAY